MTLNLIRSFAVFLTLFCSLSQLEAQVSYSLSDKSLSSIVRSHPVRSTVRRVRSAAPKIVPTFDRLGRFNREAAYRHNEDRPLAGLFAADFELTASVFGGWNRIAGFGTDSDSEIFDDDFAVGFAYGRRHNKRLRSEFEFAYRSNESSANGGEGFAALPLFEGVQVLSIMKNFIIDVESANPNVKPYVGIGIGYANVDLDFRRSSGVEVENSSTFAWQPMGGVNFRLTERFNYYVEYRYFATSDLEISQAGFPLDNGTYQAHNIFMGMRFEF